MPEAIQNIIDILQKIWQGIANNGSALETLSRWFSGLNDWLNTNAGVSLKEITQAIANLFIWLFKLILKIIQLIIDLLEKING